MTRMRDRKTWSDSLSFGGTMIMSVRHRRIGHMAERTTRGVRGILAGVAFAIALTAGLAGCHGLMDVSDPTLIQDKDIANAAGANARRINSIMQLSFNISYIVSQVANLTDERMIDLPDVPTSPPWGYYDYDTDRRDGDALKLFQAANVVDPHLATLSTMFVPTTLAITAMRVYGADTVKGEYLAQLFAIRSYLALQMAEDICSGFPINDVTTDNQAIQSGPYTTDSAMTYALAQADSALADGRDTARFLDFARVVKGRALLDLGRFDEAAAAVTAVPTSFTYTTDPSTLGNTIYTGCCFTFAVGEHEGGNGLPFVSTSDPRVPTFFQQVRANDASDSLYDQAIYTSQNDPIVLASGTEARLIEAEAALHASDPTTAYNIINALRTSAGMGTLSVPGTPDAQVDTLYKERAFWLYLTGHRLGDLRRLISRYGRNPEAVFPSGSFPLGGTYGTATSFPFTVEAQGRYNPNIRVGCTP